MDFDYCVCSIYYGEYNQSLSSVIFSLYVCKRGIRGPPFPSLHTFFILLLMNDLDCCQWYVLFPVEFDFFILTIVERVRLFEQVL